jgi:hypothetical protein
VSSPCRATVMLRGGREEPCDRNRMLILLEHYQQGATLGPMISQLLVIGYKVRLGPHNSIS